MWAEADRVYDTHLAELVELGQPHVTTAKAKGKQRASSQDLEDPLPRIDELPDRSRGGVNLALKVLAENSNEKTSLTQQLSDLEFEVCPSMLKRYCLIFNFFTPFESP